jgi:hypothetical protein
MDEHYRMSKRIPKNAEERKRGELNSGIASHVWDTKHTVDFKNPEIVSENWEKYQERLAAETYYIAKFQNNCNIMKSSLHPAWSSVMRRTNGLILNQQQPPS